jgi:hypothetical protein
MIRRWAHIFPPMVVIIKNVYPGNLNNFTEKYRGASPSNRLQMNQDRQPYTNQQKIQKKSSTII